MYLEFDSRITGLFRMILCRNLQPVRCSAAKRCNTGLYLFMAGGSDKRHVVVHEADDAVMILRIPIARPRDCTTCNRDSETSTVSTLRSAMRAERRSESLLS